MELENKEEKTLFRVTVISEEKETLKTKQK